MYQREGRRSVLSPLRHWDMSAFKTRRPATQAAEANTGTSQHLNRPIVVIKRSSVQCTGGSDTAAREIKAPAPIGKERSGSIDNCNKKSQLQPARFYQNLNRLSSLPSASAETARNTMASPRRIRLTRGFEDLKTQESQRTKLPIPKHNLSPSPMIPTTHKVYLQTPSHDYAKENDTPYLQSTVFPQTYSRMDTSTSKGANSPGSKLPRASPTTRRKSQVDKMVPTPLPPKNPCHTVHISDQVLSGVSNRKSRPVLTPHLAFRSQIETAMPQGYWLGRLMTLTNAFHYEDSFNEPDIATGFEMPSSYSRPFQGSNDGDLAGYRVKRAFMVLENLCVTEEASASLRGFRDAYSRRFGDRWMD
ncbi:uncharacterized protein BDV17DRAFT_254036 [Aspergillus undulatus]|uniref:uncharacterized protein n=1 Tax=Aspergillus undulatus TaxID=1810928 RepID=UPI003CCCEFE0